MKVAVVSPHLDDAVLSIGGTICDLVLRGAEVTIVTVFAGDPDSEAPASYWDATRGEATQGAAVQMRRHEDEGAGAELGATTRALPWPDSGYVAARDPAAIWADLGPIVESASLAMVPGWPLGHADHRYTTLLVLERLSSDVPVAFYAEQPYAAEPLTLLKGALRDRTVAPLRHAYRADIAWRRQHLSGAARVARAKAVANYEGELENLGIRGHWARLVRELTGEWIGIGQHTTTPNDLGFT